MEIGNKVDDFLKAPEEIVTVKNSIKKFFIAIIVIAIIAFIVFVIMGEIRFMWILVVCAIPYFILFIVMYISRFLNYKMFVRKIHSQGLDSKIENGIILSNSKVCLADNYIIYNDVFNVMPAGVTKYRLRCFILDINKIDKIIEESEYVCDLCILCDGMKKYPMRTSEFDKIVEYILSRTTNKSVKVISFDEKLKHTTDIYKNDNIK